MFFFKKIAGFYKIIARSWKIAGGGGGGGGGSTSLFN